jgi:hypothetical protein
VKTLETENFIELKSVRLFANDCVEDSLLEAERTFVESNFRETLNFPLFDKAKVAPTLFVLENLFVPENLDVTWNLLDAKSFFELENDPLFPNIPLFENFAVAVN